MDRFLLVKGCAGIGNRLFTLASALEYADKTGRKVIVDWRDGVFTEPSEDAFDLFFRLENTSIATMADIRPDKGLSYYPSSLKLTLDQYLYRNYRAAASKTLIRVPGTRKLKGRMSRLAEFWQYNPGNNFGQQIYSDNAAIRALFSSGSVEYGNKLSIGRKEDVVLFADYWPGEIAQKYFDRIKLTDTLRNRIDEHKRRLGFAEKTTGIHIRYTDKKPGRKIESLLETLKNMESDSKFFLATDNRDIEKLFRKEFGTNLLSLDKYYPDDNFNMHHAALKSGDYSHARQVYEESLVDIFLLASCGRFYYQGNSSFSKIALKFAIPGQSAIDWLQPHAL